MALFMYMCDERGNKYLFIHIYNEPEVHAPVQTHIAEESNSVVRDRGWSCYPDGMHPSQIWLQVIPYEANA